MQRNLAGVIAHKIKALVDKPEGFPVAAVERCGLNERQLVDDFLKFNFTQTIFRIAILNEGTKVIQKQNILILPVDALAVDIGISLLLKQRNDSRFQLCLGELAFYECVVHAVASFTVGIGLLKQSTTGSD